jgi:predicted dehydrogenase
MSPDVTRRSFLRAAAAIAGTVLAASPARPRAAFGAADKPRVKLGQIGTTHAHAGKLGVYRRSPDYDVVGVVEPDDARWARAADDPAFRGLPRLTEAQLFDVPGLAAVTVETAVGDLVPTAGRCVAAGLHVHLDKPAGESLDALRHLLAAATAKGRLVQLGYMLRYSPATALLKTLTAAGALGDVFEVTAVMSKVVPAGERKRLGRFPGGMMFELGCHVIDQVVGLLGRPDKIDAYPLATTDPGDELKDNCLAVFRYPKATATVRSTALEVDGGSRRQFVVCGTGGTLRVEPLEPPEVRLSLATDAAGFKRGSQQVPMPKYERYAGDAADMAAVVRGEKASDYPPAHDLLVHECVLRASGVA